MYTLVINNNVLSENMMIADDFFKRLRGLMFQKDICFDCLLIKPCNSIHTFNMKFELDVIWIDFNGRVIKKMCKIKPNKIIKSVKGGFIVVEAKVGFFDAVKVGDVIDYSRTI